MLGSGRAGIVSICLLGATGCLSVLPEPETPDALYAIEAVAGGPELTANITIREPEAGRLISGTALVSKDAGGALRLIRGAEWAGPATRQMQLALVDSFSTSLSGAAVLPESGVRTQFQLSSRIQTLGLIGEIAECSVSVGVVHGRSRELIAQTRISAQQLATGPSTPERAQALKAATQRCVQDMARFGAKTLAQTADEK